MSDISLVSNVLKAFKCGHGKYMVIRASIHWPVNVLPQDLEKSQSRKIRIQTFSNALQFGIHIGSSATEMPIKYQSDTIIIKSNFAFSRLHDIWR